MPRANSSVPRHRRHRKIIKQAKGYYGARSRTFKSAKDAVVKAGLYAYRDRRQKKRMFRRLWITRINAGCRINGIKYSVFIHGLKEKGISQTWLADKLGKSFNTVNGYVQNRHQPRLEVLNEIAEILDIDIKELLNSNKKSK